MKEKIKLVIVFVLGIMISVVISVYATTVIGASEVSFNGGISNIKYNGTTAANVSDAINGVYSSANTLATNVTALNTYTFNTPVKIGTFNGKPLYRLVKQVSVPANTTTTNVAFVGQSCGIMIKEFIAYYFSGNGYYYSESDLIYNLGLGNNNGVATVVIQTNPANGSINLISTSTRSYTATISLLYTTS